jgi:hypothetical protein
MASELAIIDIEWARSPALDSPPLPRQCRPSADVGRRASGAALRNDWYKARTGGSARGYLLATDRVSKAADASTAPSPSRSTPALRSGWWRVRPLLVRSGTQYAATIRTAHERAGVRLRPLAARLAAAIR